MAEPFHLLFLLEHLEIDGAEDVEGARLFRYP
jgi:hypothetical protein